MSQTGTSMKQQKVDMKLEVDVIAVSDVDRSKQFYQRLGWRLDADDAPLEGLRIVQFTPPVVLVESKPQLQLNHQSRK